jgi:hypothetical protein
MPAGRPFIVPSDELIDKVAGFVAAGHYMETACAFAGVAKHTFLMWLKEGRRYQRMKEERPDETLPDPRRESYLKFLEKIEKAMATAEVRDLTVIDKVAQGGLDMGQTTRTVRRVPVLNNVTGAIMIDEHGQVIYREEVTEVIATSKTLPQWTAAAWRLERRNADRWSRTSKHQVSNKASDLIPIDSMRQIIDGTEDTDTPDIEL